MTFNTNGRPVAYLVAHDGSSQCCVLQKRREGPVGREAAKFRYLAIENLLEQLEVEVSLMIQPEQELPYMIQKPIRVLDSEQCSHLTGTPSSLGKSCQDSGRSTMNS